jgi:hypothetical protein
MSAADLSTIDELFRDADAEAWTRRGDLEHHCDRVGMVSDSSNARRELADAIREYAVSAARVEVYRIMKTQDFYHAMMISAGAQLTPK